MNALKGIAGIARFVVDDARGQKLIAAARTEHDKWMSTVTPGATYYTVTPSYPARPDMADTRDEHRTFIFSGKRGQWPYRDQLEATNGALSWDIWFDEGPLALSPKPTAAGYQAGDRAAQAAFEQRADGHVRAAVLAEMQRLYPKSLALHR